MDSETARRQTLERSVQAVGAALMKCLPKDVGFTLVLYNYGENGDMAYLSSGDREGTLAMLGELLRYMKGSTAGVSAGG